MSNWKLFLESKIADISLGKSYQPKQLLNEAGYLDQLSNISRDIGGIYKKVSGLARSISDKMLEKKEGQAKPSVDQYIKRSELLMANMDPGDPKFDNEIKQLEMLRNTARGKKFKNIESSLTDSIHKQQSKKADHFMDMHIRGLALSQLSKMKDDKGKKYPVDQKEVNAGVKGAHAADQILRDMAQTLDRNSDARAHIVDHFSGLKGKIDGEIKKLRGETETEKQSPAPKKPMFGRKP